MYQGGILCLCTSIIIAKTLDPLSRLKGIETLTIASAGKVSNLPLDPLSRLKGIETLRSPKSVEYI